MAGKPWSASELLDLQIYSRAEDWPAFHERHPERGFDAWEVKRRRISKPEEAERAVGPREHPIIHRAEGCVNFGIGFYDIETTMSRWPRLLTTAVADGHGNWQLLDYYTHPGEQWWDDKALTEGVLEMLRPFNILVGWNSKAFDLRVINARAILHGLAPLRPQLHLDLMNVYKYSVNFGSARLENIGEVFESEHHKIRVSPGMHQRAEAGDKEAYDVLREHNVADVLLTRDVFQHVRHMVTSMTKSPLF